MKIKYNNINYSIGEYQIHSNRDGVKFRFNRNNFHNLMEKINENKIEVKQTNEVIKEKPKEVKIKKNKSTKKNLL